MCRNSGDSNQILLIGKDHQALIVNYALGAKSAVYDCLVVVVAVNDCVTLR